MILDTLQQEYEKQTRSQRMDTARYVVVMCIARSMQLKVFLYI